MASVKQLTQMVEIRRSATGNGDLLSIARGGNELGERLTPYYDCVLVLQIRSLGHRHNEAIERPDIANA
ncbi:MAG: hypothetical protein WDZ50_08860 [Woeseia sp.]